MSSIAKYKKSSPQSYKKVLKGVGGNVYSREINKKDRLVYEIYEEKIVVYIISVEGHYNDK